MKHTRVVSTKCTPGFACRAFSDTTLVCFIVNEHTTKCSRYRNFINPMRFIEIIYNIIKIFHSGPYWLILKCAAAIWINIGHQGSSFNICHGDTLPITMVSPLMPSLNGIGLNRFKYIPKMSFHKGETYFSVKHCKSILSSYPGSILLWFPHSIF